MTSTERRDAKMPPHSTDRSMHDALMQWYGRMRGVYLGNLILDMHWNSRASSPGLFLKPTSMWLRFCPNACCGNVGGEPTVSYR